MCGTGRPEGACIDLMHLPSPRHLRPDSTDHMRGSVPISVALGAALLGLLACTAARPTATTTRAVTAAQTASGILVRVNQVGFPVAVPKVATVLTQGALRSRAFRVVNAGGATVLAGTTGRDRGAWNSRWA